MNIRLRSRKCNPVLDMTIEPLYDDPGARFPKPETIIPKRGGLAT